jgi:pyridoxine 5-phosphate synthase
LRLGVNIDHIATLREARKTDEPDPVKGAVVAVQAGADQITLHLREDRRHIQDEDLFKIRCTIKEVPVNLEMAPTEEMKIIATSVKPDTVTLVPEKRQEITTEGGLDVISNQSYLKDFIKEIKKAGIKVSLFIDPDKEQIEVSKKIDADAVELHTGEYANQKNIELAKKEVERIKEAAKFSKNLGLEVVAGHGLTYNNVKPIAAIKEIEELNIGHSIIANSIFWGLSTAVKRMKRLMREAREIKIKE